MNESSKCTVTTNRVSDKVTPKIGAPGMIRQVAEKTNFVIDPVCVIWQSAKRSRLKTEIRKYEGDHLCRRLPQKTE
jgi:hypothetical protein